MKKLFLLLLPSIAILVSSCSSGPGPVYGGGEVYGGGAVYGGGTEVYYGGPYGPGPNPQPGYYWNGDVYIGGRPPWWSTGYTYNGVHYNAYSVSHVDVNRTNYNRRTVNDTTVNSTNYNNRTVNNTTVNRTNVNDRNVNVRNVKRVNFNKTNVVKRNGNERKFNTANVEAAHRKVVPREEKRTAHPRGTPVP
jgi:hypothetical protein